MTAPSAVVYAAKSTADTHGSIPDQLADCRAMADREGWEIVAEYGDEGHSAFSGNRGQGLADAKAHAERLAQEDASCVLVVQHSDRLARGDGIAADHLVEHVLWARKAGVQWVSIQDPQTFDGMGLVYAALMGDRNHEDSKRKSTATRDGKRRRFERGYALGGPIPDGYERVVRPDGEFSWEPSERAAIIGRMFERAWEGALDSTIARELNAAGHRTQRGKPWSRRRVHDTLTNPFYAGRVQRHGEVAEGRHDSLVDGGTFDALQAMRKARGGKYRDDRPRSNAGRTTSRYVLSKLAVCERCGERMYATTGGGGNRRYVCANVHRGGGLCSAPVVSANIVDDEFVSRLRELFIDHDEWVSRMVSARDAKRDGIEREVTTAAAELVAAEHLRAKAEGYLLKRLEAGDDPELAQRAFDRQTATVHELESVIRAGEKTLAEADQQIPSDAHLDFYVALRAALREAVEADEIAQVNEKLRSVFAEVRIDTTGKGSSQFVQANGECPVRGVILMQPVLRGDTLARLTNMREADSPPNMGDVTIPGGNKTEHEGQPSYFDGLDALLDFPEIVATR